MEIKKGLVVCNKAGRDKGRFFVVISCNDRDAYISDGKYRKLIKPKRKNLKHLAVTRTVIENENMLTDKRIRLALKKFNG